MRIISLGWGRQSYTLAWMAALGLIEADVAIHADTTWESQATLEFIRRNAPKLTEAGLELVNVTTPAVKQANTVNVPLYMNKGGVFRRQCTERWKIRPMLRWIRENVPNYEDVVTDVLLGISLNEQDRAKPSRVGYTKNVFPLLDLKMTVSDCINWLEARGLEVPPKSACVFCPYRTFRSWRDLSEADIAVAVGQEKHMQALLAKKGKGDVGWVTKTRRDLDTINFHDQADVFEDGGCDSGYCWV